MRKLDILTAGERAVPSNYMIEGMLPFWRERGFDVLIRPIGEATRRPDVSIAHVDRTFVDEALLEAERRIAPVVNGAVADISKRRISSALVSQSDDYEGPVIVKSDLNFHGAAERRARPFVVKAADAAWRGVKRILPSGLTKDLPHYDYPIYPTKEDAPRWIWSDERYVVERFMPERDGDDYVLRTWLFFGDRRVVRRNRSPSPIVKARSTVSREQLDAPPPELVALRKELGFDYGKFDYVEIDGRAVLLDANKTPTMVGRTPQHMKLLEDFAGGLLRFCSEEASS